MQARFTDGKTKVQKEEVTGKLLRAEKQRRVQASELRLHVPTPNYTRALDKRLAVTNI